MAVVDHKAERRNDVERIKESVHPRKVIVAGPGTGKSFLFSEIIKKKRAEGKSKFLAVTFIGKLGDTLADDLCGLATTTTLHSFARGFVLEASVPVKGWKYYPEMYKVISEDLKGEEIPRLCRGGSSSLTFQGVHPRNSRREPTKAHVQEKPDGPIGEFKSLCMGVQIPRSLHSQMPPPSTL